MTLPSDYQQTPLFQMNLLLWTAWSTSHAGIEPIFRKNGFDLYAIGQQFVLPMTLGTKLRNNSIRTQNSAAPDLLLRNKDQNIFMPLECKLRSFGAESSDIEQANCLLCHTGFQIAQNIGSPSPKLWSSHLFYAVADGYQVPMLNTLSHLSVQLQALSVETADIGSIGILIQPSDGVYVEISHANNFSQDLQIPDGWIKVKELEDGESPEPPYLMPFDLSSGELDPTAIRSIEERVRSALAILIMQRIHKESFGITEDELMGTAFEIWKFWKEEKQKIGLLRKIRPFVWDTVNNLKAFGAVITYANREIRFVEITGSVSKRIRKYIRGKAYRTGETVIRTKLGEILTQPELPLNYDD